MSIVTIGINLAKQIFAVHVVNTSGKVELIKPKLPSDQLLALICQPAAVLSAGLGISALDSEWLKRMFRVIMCRQ